jgi:hypothetical protein
LGLVDRLVESEGAAGIEPIVVGETRRERVVEADEGVLQTGEEVPAELLSGAGAKCIKGFIDGIGERGIGSVRRTTVTRPGPEEAVARLGM